MHAELRSSAQTPKAQGFVGTSHTTWGMYTTGLTAQPPRADADLHDTIAIVPEWPKRHHHAASPHELDALASGEGCQKREVVGQHAVCEQAAARGRYVKWVACSHGTALGLM